MTSASGGSRTYSLDPGAGGASFARLVFGLLRQRFTGTVSLEQRAPAGQRTIWVRGGMPVFCDWDSPGDQLGELLCDAGNLAPDALERALAEQAREPSRLLGAILIELGSIDAKTLARALRTQCARKLARVFGQHASEGEATVTAVAHDKGDGDGLSQINVLGLLCAGVSRSYDEARAEAELGEALHGNLVASPALARYESQFGFGPGDAAILGALGRGVTFDRLVGPGVDRRRVLQVIYILWVTQMLRTGDDAAQAIAKGATAAAAAQEQGVTIGRQTEAKTQAATPPPAPKAKPKPKPKPKPKSAKPPPPPKPKAARPPAPEPTPAEPKPEPSSEPEPGADDAAFERQLEQLEQLVADEAHAFALFGLDLEAGRKDVRAAWAELSKNFHPDGLEGRGLARLQPRVERVFAALSEAYGVLGNKDERAQLREALMIGGDQLKAGEDANTVVRNAFEAELIAREADKFLKAKQWPKAAELYAKAVALSPQDFDIEAGLHYAEFRAGDQTAPHARATIEQLAAIIEAQPACARAYYFAGLIRLSLEDFSGAKTNFTKASVLDPRNIDAERQLRVIRMRERGEASARAEAKKSTLGGLRGLFKKS